VNQPFFIAVKLSQPDGTKVDIPDSVGDLAEPDRFTGQSFAEVDMTVFS